MQHELKIELPYADAIYRGDKNFEVRYNDRGYQKGDTIVFIPIDSGIAASIVCSSHKLYQAQYTITYVHSGLGLKEGYVVLGIQETSAYEKFLKEQEEQQNYEEAIAILKEKFGVVTPDNADSSINYIAPSGVTAHGEYNNPFYIPVDNGDCTPV